MRLKEFLEDAVTKNKQPESDKKFRLLCVEDDVVNWEVAVLHLGKRYEIVPATTAREAFQRLAEGEYRAILMDIQLAKSDLDGMTIARILRGTYGGAIPEYARNVKLPRIPIIFMTAFAARYKREDWLAAGGDDLLVKPVNFVTLASVLSRAIIKNV